MTQAVFTPAGVDHVVLRVRDLPRMLAFYRDVLGCPVERELAHIGLYQLRAGRSLIDLAPVDGKVGRGGGAAPGTEGHNVDHIALAIRPFDDAEVRAHLAAHGVEVIGSAVNYGAEGDSPSLIIRDPEGNMIELMGPGAMAKPAEAA